MDTFYDKQMSELCREYNAYVAQAQNTNRRNNYTVSVDEYKFYIKAAETARKISNLNASERAVFQQWSDRAVMNERKAIQIYNILNPQKPEEPEKPAPQDSGKKSSQPAQPQPERNVPTSAKEGQYVTTASGFRTRNASDDVSAETIEKWYQEKPNHGLADIVGMEDMKKTITEEIIENIGWDKTDALLDIPALKSFLFYGPFGTGKSHFVEAVARELMDKGFKFIKLTGSDVHDSYVGVGEKIVQTAFKEAVDNAPAILYFDEFENMCPEREKTTEGHEKRLTVAFMEAYNIINNSDKPIVFLAATNYPDKVEHAMLSRIITNVPVPLPSEEVRLEFFKKKTAGFMLEDGFDYEYMADVTDNYSFRDLKKIVDRLKLTVKSEAKKRFTVYDDAGNRLPEESDESVSNAIAEGRIRVTKEMFDQIYNTTPPEKKSEILASIEAFENKT